MRILSFFLVLWFCNPVHASDPNWVNCVDVKEEDKPLVFKVSATQLGVAFEGVMKVPSSGYTYALEQENVEGHTMYMRLTLVPPAMGLTVISELNISEQLENLPQNIRSVHIHVDKKFNWGVDEMLCSF